MEVSFQTDKCKDKSKGLSLKLSSFLMKHDDGFDDFEEIQSLPLTVLVGLPFWKTGPSHSRSK